MLVVIGLQLIPPKPMDAIQLRVQQWSPVAARGRAVPRHPARGRDDPRPGRPAVHLLPVLIHVSRRPPRTLVDLTKARRFDVGQLLKAVVLVCVLLLFITSGPGIREAGEQMDPGLERTLVLAVGEPAGALGDVIPLHEVADEATAWLSTDEDLGEGGGFSAVAQSRAQGGGVAPVTPEAFDPAAVGEQAQAAAAEEAARHRRLARACRSTPSWRAAWPTAASRSVRDPHIGTGISKDILARLGEALDEAGRGGAARRRRDVHRRQRGLPAPGPRGQGRRVLRQRVGRALRARACGR